MVATVVAAFTGDPGWGWFLGPGFDRLAPLFAGALFDQRVGGGTVWMTDDAASVSLWDPPGGPDPQIVEAVWRTFHDAAGPESLTRLAAYDTALGQASPSGSYWYLGVLATHPDRPTAGYRIDFAASKALDYVPLFRLRSGVSGQEVFQPGWSIRLDPTHLAFMQHVDGERSIREIAQRAAQSGMLGQADQKELEYIALELFEGLWRSDFIAVDLSGATA